MLPPKAWAILRYLFAGTTAALGNIAILFTLVHFLHFHYLLGAILSYIGSIGFGFLLQKFWAFRDKAMDRAHVQLALYTTVTLMNLCINTAVMYVLVSLLGIWYVAAQVLAGGVIAVTGYIAYQAFVFTPKK